jgi:hypothetical protein
MVMLKAFKPTNGQTFAADTAEGTRKKEDHEKDRGTRLNRIIFIVETKTGQAILRDRRE